MWNHSSEGLEAVGELAPPALPGLEGGTQNAFKNSVQVEKV